MNWRNPFRAPSIEDSARQLAEHRCLNDKARYRERARLMRARQGMEPHPALERRT